MDAAISTWDMIQPPKISPEGLVSAGMANTRIVGSPEGRVGVETEVDVDDDDDADADADIEGKPEEDTMLVTLVHFFYRGLALSNNNVTTQPHGRCHTAVFDAPQLCQNTDGSHFCITGKVF